MERAVVLSKGDIITASDLPETLRREDAGMQRFASATGAGSLKAALVAPERQIILEALESNGWNRQKTARNLGINRTTLYKKMKKYGIEFEKQYSI